MDKQRAPKNIFVQGAIPAEKIADAIAGKSSKTNVGAQSIFLGQVRADEKEGGSVKSIVYSAYEEMAIQKAFEIREDIFQKYPITCMNLYHSLGEVAVGEICLFVLTASAHRKAAIDACSELVERIKKEVPVWGKEMIDSGSSVWKENR